MKHESLEQFWLDKEKERKSTLVIATAAEYLGGFPGLAGPLQGLLYVMKNGIYFENSKDAGWWRGVFRDVFHIDEDFTKITLELKKKDVIDVSCFKGQGDKLRLTLKERLAYLAGLIPRRLLVEYRRPEGACSIAFACSEPPIRLCAAYYGARDKDSRLAGRKKKR